MTCCGWEVRFDERLDGHGAADLEAHARDCPECAARLAEVERLLAALDAMPPVKPPPGLAARITGAVLADQKQRRREKLRRWAAPLGLAAAAALLFVLGPPASRPPSIPAPAPEAAALRDRVNQAGQAMASLTARTAEVTVEETARLLPTVGVPPIEPPPGPPMEPIREAGERVETHLQPLTGPARRAVNLFFRDLSVAVR